MSEANFSFTSKVNGDLFCVRGATPDEFIANLTAVVTNELIDYCLAFQEAAQAAGAAKQSGVAVAKDVLGARPAPQATPRPAPAPQPAPAPVDKPEGSTPTCAHGQMTWREGLSGPNSKNPGTPYKMWACPSPNRNDQCRPIWAGGR